MSHATKKWEVFPGRNKFCMDGRVIMGPDATVFYINVFLIIGTTLLFLIFDCPFLAEKVSISIPVITIAFFVFVISTLLRTSFTDPGIIPRATADEAVYIEKQIKISACGEVSAERPPPRTKEVTIKGQNVKLKYCFTCKIFRPPRASHCSLCDNCVDHFDHHCPWVGNCVGRRNYRYFYLFTVALSFYIAFVFICTCTHLYLLSRNRVMVEAIADSPASVIVILITFFSCWSVFGLAGFHTYLAASNQTTNEDIKGSFSNKRGGSSRNPYSFGNGCSNCCYVLCGPFPTSLIDSEGFVTPDLINKKAILERQSSKLTTATAYASSNSINGFHQHTNGASSYSTISQLGTKLHSAAMSSPHLGKNLVQKASPPLPYGNANSIYLKTKAVCKNDATKACADTHFRNHAVTVDVSEIDLDLDDVEVLNNDKNSSSLAPWSASKLKLLHDTTMIESALDLDSLEESALSEGANSHAGLMKAVKQNL